MTENARNVVNYLVAGLLGALCTGILGMMTFGRTIVTRDEMQSYVRDHSPYAEDKPRMDELWEIEHQKDIEFETEIRELVRNQQRVMEKLNITP